MNKKIYQLVIICLALCLPNVIFAENAESIIAKHIEAHGGLKNWNKVESIKVTGQFTAFSIEKDFMAYKNRSGEYYADLQLGKHQVIEAFDGKEGWTIDPWQEITYARRINTGEKNVFSQKAEILTPFFDYKEKGHKVEFVAKEKLEGLDVFVLKLTRNNGKEEKWYLDANTYLEYKCESKWVDFAQELPSETFFDDFRKVDGLVIPFFVERTFWQRDRLMQIENVEINPTFDNKLLDMPKREEIKKLAFLEGKWDVKMEAMSRRGTWRSMGQTLSAIDFASTSVLQEKIKVERTFPINITLSYTYNDNCGKYRISLLEDLSSSFEVFEGDFSDNIFVFDNAKEKMATFTQFTLSDIGDEGFTLTRRISRDQGKTWQDRDKFTYTRSE